MRGVGMKRSIAPYVALCTLCSCVLFFDDSLPESTATTPDSNLGVHDVAPSDIPVDDGDEPDDFSTDVAPCDGAGAPESYWPDRDDDGFGDMDTEPTIGCFPGSG